VTVSGALCRTRRVACYAVAVGYLCAAGSAQDSRPDVAGIWSDPPATIEDTFCLFYCTDAGLERLEQLLDDEANDERPVMELYADAATFQRDEYLKPRLTAAGVATLGVDSADDPGFLECEPWAFARQIFAPHQLQIEQHVDRVELLYGEWTIRRIACFSSAWFSRTAPRCCGRPSSEYRRSTSSAGSAERRPPTAGNVAEGTAA
jgi:hypothetical protein